VGYRQASRIRGAEARSQPAVAASAKPVPSRVSTILELQQTFGNRAVQQLLYESLIQTKRAVSESGDQQEEKAEKIAKQIMRIPEPGMAERVGSRYQHEARSGRSLTSSARSPGILQRQQGPTQSGTQKPATTRSAAEAQLFYRWRVGRVYEGSLVDQAARLDHFRMSYFGSADTRSDISDMLTRAGWRAWSPPDGSSVWQWLVGSFEQFDRVFGGIPKVQEIAFYETDYAFVPSGPALRPKSEVVADFGGGLMAVYHAAETGATQGRLPTGRSTERAEAPVPAPTKQEGFQFFLIHEMGHGLVESVLGSIDRNMMRDYEREVGWHQGRLYDAGVEAVRTDIAAGRTPEARYWINDTNWNSGSWQEQPITFYMTTHSSEDFPEAVATYILHPDLFRERSPKRFAFIDSRLASFRPGLMRDLSRINLNIPGLPRLPGPRRVPTSLEINPPAPDKTPEKTPRVTFGTGLDELIKMRF